MPAEKAPSAWTGTPVVVCDPTTSPVADLTVRIRVLVSIFVISTVSWFTPRSITIFSSRNIPFVELTVMVVVQLTVGPQPVVPLVSVTTTGSEMRPAWPTSCCSTSVAPRIPLCIWVRFQIVACALVILSSAPTAAPDINSMMAMATINSMSEKPECDRVCCMRILERLGLQNGQRRRGLAGAAEAARNRRRHRDPFQVRGHLLDLPHALVEPSRRRGGANRGRAVRRRRAAQVSPLIEVVDVELHGGAGVGAATDRQAESARRGSGKHARIADLVGVRERHQLLHLVLRVLGGAGGQVPLVFRRRDRESRERHQSRHQRDQQRARHEDLENRRALFAGTRGPHWVVHGAPAA